MAIRVRCKHCRKKISMDEAFAGGVSRCPYCKQLNMVPGGPGGGAPGDRPDRPDVPGAAAPAELAASAQEAIPMARPVFVQGVVAMVFAGLLLVAVAAGVILLVLRPDDRGQTVPVGTQPVADKEPDVPSEAQPPPQQPNPLAQAGPRILKAELASPVVYVVDGSSGTGDALLDVARLCVWHSVLGLGQSGQFNLIYAGADGTRKLTPRWDSGGKAGYKRVREFLAGVTASGSSDLDAAVAEAIELAPKSVVVLAGKAPNDPAALAAEAKRGGAAVHCISLGAYVDVTESMKRLAEPTGGRCQPYRDYEIIDWHERAPPLP